MRSGVQVSLVYHTVQGVLNRAGGPEQSHGANSCSVLEVAGHFLVNGVKEVVHRLAELPLC